MRSPFRLCELEQVVRGADHCPFPSDLLEPAEKELAKAPGMLDLTKHRLGNLFTQPVATTPACTSEFDCHRSNTRSTTPTLATAIGFAVLCPARRDVAVDAAVGHMQEVFFRTEARIGRHFFGGWCKTRRAPRPAKA